MMTDLTRWTVGYDVDCDLTIVYHIDCNNCWEMRHDDTVASILNDIEEHNCD